MINLMGQVGASHAFHLAHQPSQHHWQNTLEGLDASVGTSLCLSPVSGQTLHGLLTLWPMWVGGWRCSLDKMLKVLQEMACTTKYKPQGLRIKVCGAV